MMSERSIVSQNGKLPWPGMIVTVFPEQPKVTRPPDVGSETDLRDYRPDRWNLGRRERSG